MNTDERVDHVRIFDTTLRDGEQAPGCSMKTSEKLRILEDLIKLNVDIVEAGYPASSKGDFDAVQSIAGVCSKEGMPRICGLSRLIKLDIDRCIEAIAPAFSKRIHVFIATSPIHMQYKLRLSPEEVLREIEHWVSYASAQAAKIGADVEFSCEDATRSDLDFMVQAYQSAIDCGATTLNVPDTVGYTLPGIFGDTVRQLGRRLNFQGQPLADLKNGEVILSVHGHDDLGLAVANFLAGIEHGARQVECTMLGIGERAGNGSMEELVMALRTHRDFFRADTRIDSRHFTSATENLAKIIGYQIPRNKPIVGSNVFAHEAGIHVQGVLANSLTYEHMKAEDVGQETKIVLGKHSGKAAYRDRVRNYGLYEVLGPDDEAREDAIVELTRLCKAWADVGKQIPDFILLQIIAKEILGMDLSAHTGTVNDLLHLIWSTKMNFADPFSFSHYEQHTVSTEGCHLRVHLRSKGEIVSKSVEAKTEVNALFLGIKDLVGMPTAELVAYDVHGDKGAAGEGLTICKVRCDDITVEVQVSDDSVIKGNAEAFIRAFNLIALNQFIRSLKTQPSMA